MSWALDEFFAAIERVQRAGQRFRGVGSPEVIDFVSRIPTDGRNGRRRGSRPRRGVVGLYSSHARITLPSSRFADLHVKWLRGAFFSPTPTRFFVVARRSTRGASRLPVDRLPEPVRAAASYVPRRTRRGSSACARRCRSPGAPPRAGDVRPVPRRVCGETAKSRGARALRTGRTERECC